MAEELTVIGLLNEREFEATFTLGDLKKHFFNCLQLGPMLDPLIKVLRDSNKFQRGVNDEEDLSRVEYKDIYRAVNSTAFLKSTPLVSATRTKLFILVREWQRDLLKHQAHHHRPPPA